jgi:thermitase
MASLILQAIQSSTGSSTSVQIQPVNVYGSSETTTSWDVAQGITAAVNAGATVLNMSLGSTGDSSVLDVVIAQAASDGITMFGATGNTPMDAPYYPAADSGVIPVTALGQPGQLASYANSWPDSQMLALPGTGTFDFDGQDWMVQGTSTSTAISSGIYAGNLAAHGWPQAQILNAMENKFPVPK